MSGTRDLVKTGMLALAPLAVVPYIKSKILDNRARQQREQDETPWFQQYAQNLQAYQRRFEHAGIGASRPRDET